MNDDELFDSIGVLYREMKKRKHEKNSFPSKSHEEKMREAFPSLQDAWERYQVILKLCMTDMPEESEEENMKRKRERIRRDKLMSVLSTKASKGSWN